MRTARSLTLLCAACSPRAPRARPKPLPHLRPDARANPGNDARPGRHHARRLPARGATRPGWRSPAGVTASFVVSGEGTTTSAATITATATMAKVVRISPAELLPGAIGEVWVVADDATEETMASVTITAARGGSTSSVVRSLPVFPMADERARDAQPYADRWVAWLASDHPELGITTATEWEPVFVSMLLVVSHYSYWSADWEMTVAWHNMIPPDDWAEVHLRRRGTETAPSIAYRIDSIAGRTAPYGVEPPEVVVRQGTPSPGDARRPAERASTVPGGRRSSTTSCRRRRERACRASWPSFGR